MNNLFLRVYQHLLPRAQAWKIAYEKTLRSFFEGLSEFPDDAREFYDDIWLDIFPETTRQLDEWEKQFGIITDIPSESERRARLDAEWKQLGGQSPSYIQNILQDAGFPVYVHEWWYYDNDFAGAIIFGNAEAVFGNANSIFGNSSAITRQTRDPNLWIDSNSVLVNKITFVNKLFTQYVNFGNAFASFGNANAVFGGFTGISLDILKYQIPTDPDTFPYFWYVGGVDFGSYVDIPAERKDEFETLILKIKPRHTWVGLFINYV